MQSFEDFKKNTKKASFEKIYSWQKVNSETYSQFCISIMKIMHNDYSCIARILKMAVGYIPAYVLVECKKLFDTPRISDLPTEGFDASVDSVVDDLMALKGYLTLGLYREETEDGDFLVREIGISDEDRNDTDEDRIYLPLDAEEDFWDSLPTAIQLVVFHLGKGRSVEELSKQMERIMIAASWALSEMYDKISEHIKEGKNALLMCALYYIMYDHGFTKLVLALSKVGMDVKHLSYLREGIKTTIEKVIETSLEKSYDKKSEWAQTKKDVEDSELQKVITATIAATKGKHGRPLCQQTFLNLDEILIGNKEMLKQEIQRFIDEMERIYDLGHLWFVLKESNHLTDIGYPSFHHAIEDFTGRKFNPDRSSRLATKLINRSDREKFWANKLSSSVQSKKLVTHWLKIFQQIP